MNRCVGVFTFDINLQHCFAVHASGVFNDSGHGIPLLQGGSDPPGGIAEAEAERIQHLAGEITVGSFPHAVILEGGQVLHVPVESQGQVSAGVLFAEKDFRQGRSAGLARIPRENFGVTFLNVQGASGGNHRYKLLCALLKCFQKFPLAFRNQQIVFVAAEVFVAGIALLAFEAGVEPDAGNRHVRLLGIHGRLGQAVVGLGQVGGPVLEKVAAEAVEHADPVRFAIRPDPLEEGHIAGTGPVVVALQGRNAVGVRADDGNCPDLCGIQRQGPVVFQQHHALFRRLQGQGIVFIRIGVGNRDAVVFAVFIEKPQQETCREKSFAGRRDHLLRHQSLLQGLEHVEISVPAVQVAAVFQGQGGAFLGRVRYLVVFVEIPNGPAVADHMAPEPPLFTQGLFQKGFASAGGFAVHAVVGAHDGFHFSVFDGFLESGQIGFGHILRAGHGVELVPDGFGAGMDGEMFAAGGDFQVFPVALESFDEPDAEPGGQIGILAVGLVAPAPSRVAEDVDIRTPDGQPLIDIAVAVGALAVELGAGLTGNHRSDLFLEILVEHGGQADGLGKDGRRAGAGNPVQHLVPPVVGRNAEPRNRGSVVFQLGGLFLNCHFRDQFPGFRGSFFSVSHDSGLLFFFLFRVQSVSAKNPAGCLHHNMKQSSVQHLFGTESYKGRIQPNSLIPYGSAAVMSFPRRGCSCICG